MFNLIFRWLLIYVIILMEIKHKKKLNLVKFFNKIADFILYEKIIICRENRTYILQ